MELGVAIDVGTKHMSLCALWLPREALTGCAPLLAEARLRVQSCRLEQWEVSSLQVSERATFPERLSAVAEFVRSRSAIFVRAAFVVVEHQMQSQMRVVAGALFAAISMVAPQVQLIFQQSSTKLHWDDIGSAVTGGTDLRGSGAYNARKKAGVAAAAFLLGTSLPKRVRRADPAQLALDTDRSPMQTILCNSEKRDDLADSLLHLLAYDVRRRATPKRGKKRRIAEPEHVELADVARVLNES